MSVKFEMIKPGDVLYDCHMHKMGNTMCSAMGVWEIKVLSIDGDSAIVSWNGNSPERYYKHEFNSSTIRRSPPEWYRSGKRCYFCSAKQSEGHRQDCRHPKAKKAIRGV